MHVPMPSLFYDWRKTYGQPVQTYGWISWIFGQVIAGIVLLKKH
jgi:hypothetical protein